MWTLGILVLTFAPYILIEYSHWVTLLTFSPFWTVFPCSWLNLGELVRVKADFMFSFRYTIAESHMWIGAWADPSGL